MKYVIAIDPGVHEVYVAYFSADSTLCDVRRHEPFTLASGLIVSDVIEVIVERPQYDGRSPKHLIDLAINGAFIAGMFAAPTKFVTPRKWKGSQRKPQHHARAWKILSGDERGVFPEDTGERIERAVERGAISGWKKPGAYYYGSGKGSDIHNYLDAAALGLWYFGRL